MSESEVVVMLGRLDAGLLSTTTERHAVRETSRQAELLAAVLPGTKDSIDPRLRQGTWAVPATRPMEPSFRQGSFQKPSVLSAQAAGSDSPPGPRSKIFTLFLEGFCGPACLRPRYINSLRRGFFGNVKKVCSEDHIEYVGWGFLRDPLF